MPPLRVHLDDGTALSYRTVAIDETMTVEAVVRAVAAKIRRPDLVESFQAWVESDGETRFVDSEVVVAELMREWPDEAVRGGGDAAHRFVVHTEVVFEDSDEVGERVESEERIFVRAFLDDGESSHTYRRLLVKPGMTVDDLARQALRVKDATGSTARFEREGQIFPLGAKELVQNLVSSWEKDAQITGGDEHCRLVFCPEGVTPSTIISSSASDIASSPTTSAVGSPGGPESSLAAAAAAAPSSPPTSPTLSPSRAALLRPSPYLVMGNQAPSHETGALFEHFLTVGIDLEEYRTNQGSEVHEPRLLFRYPPGKDDEPLANASDLAHFCFPRRIKVDLVETTGSGSRIQELLHTPTRIFNTRNSFVFVMTGEECPLYGICVSQPELVQDLPTFCMPPGATPSLTRNRTQFAPVAPRVYCLVTRFPFFKFFFNVLYHILGQERLMRLHWEEDQGLVDRPKHPQMATPTEILASFLEQRIPIGGESINYTLPEAGTITLYRPREEIKMVSEWSLPRACHHLSLEQLVMVVNALLVEKPVVVVSTNLGVLTAVVMAVLCLLQPLRWQGLLLPVMPDRLLRFLEAPVPFLVGVHHLPDEFHDLDAAIIDVDKNTIRISGSKLPVMPSQFQLLKNLRRPYNILSGGNATASVPRSFGDLFNFIDADRTPREPTRDDIASAIDATLAAMGTYYAWLFEGISSALPAKPKSISAAVDHLRRHYPAAVQRRNRPFVASFLHTQIFSVYVPELLHMHPGLPAK